jgi:hypothetical protein
MAVHAYIPNIAGSQGGIQTICTSPEYVARVDGPPPEMENTLDNPCRALVRFNINYHQGVLTENDLIRGSTSTYFSIEAVAVIINNTQMKKIFIKTEQILVSLDNNESKFTHACDKLHKVDIFADIIKWGRDFRLNFPIPNLNNGDQLIFLPILSVQR